MRTSRFLPDLDQPFLDPPRTRDHARTRRDSKTSTRATGMTENHSLLQNPLVRWVRRVALASGVLTGWLLSASAQEFALEPIGFETMSDPSANGDFELSGSFAVASGSAMSGGAFVMTGEFRNASAASAPRTGELIVNGSFEDTDLTFVRDANGAMALPVGSAAIPGWTITRNEAAWIDNTNTFGVTTPFGQQFLDLTGYAGPHAALYQTIQTAPGRRYRLSLALGSNAVFPGAAGRKTISVCAGSVATLFTLVPNKNGGDQWQTFSLPFTADADTTDIVIAGTLSGGVYLGLDNVSVVPDNSETPALAKELVVNGSFEIGCSLSFLPDGNGVMSLPLGSTEIPGWTTTGGELIWGINQNSFGPTTPYGELFLDLTGYHDSPPFGGVTQTIATTPGQSYEVALALGTDEDSPVYRGPVTVTIDAGSTSESFTFTPSGTGNQWQTFSMSFVAASSEVPLTITGTTSVGGQYIGLDNVSVVPGSPSLALEILPPANPSGPYRLQFNSVAGQNYLVLSRHDWSSTGWAPLPGSERAGTGGKIEIELPTPLSGAEQFYRLQTGP